MPGNLDYVNLAPKPRIYQALSYADNFCPFSLNLAVIAIELAVDELRPASRLSSAALPTYCGSAHHAHASRTHTAGRLHCRTRRTWPPHRRAHAPSPCPIPLLRAHRTQRPDTRNKRHNRFRITGHISCGPIADEHREQIVLRETDVEPQHPPHITDLGGERKEAIPRSHPQWGHSPINTDTATSHTVNPRTAPIPATRRAGHGDALTAP